MTKWLLVFLVLGAAGLWYATRPPRAVAPEAPPLTAEEKAAGLKIGAGWDSFKILRDVQTVEAARSPLAPEKRVLAVEIDGHARAYPIDVLNHHELLTDAVGGVPLLVSY